MRLTRFTDNALRCLIYLGRKDGQMATVGEVAGNMAMSEDHLTKVVQRLSQRGYVQTIRGRKGGMRLAKHPADIVIGQVVRDTEDDCAIAPCFSDVCACPINATCLLAPGLASALDAFFAALDRITLSELVAARPVPVVRASA